LDYPIPECRLLDFISASMMEMVVATGAVRCAKLQSPPTYWHTTFYSPDALHVTQATVSDH